MITDRFFREHNYLRVSVTDRCDLNCSYCMPEGHSSFIPDEKVLRNDEFIRIIKIFAALGIDKVRFTGGEPFVRKDFVDIVSGVRSLFPDMMIAVTTNGSGSFSYLDDMKRLGVSRINISLDTIDRKRFSLITGKDRLDAVLKTIDSAISSGFFRVRINSVLFRETIQELPAYLGYFAGKDADIRFIERMPFPGQQDTFSFLPSSELLKWLSENGTLSRRSGSDTRVARMYNYLYMGKYSMKIGVIPPVSEKFCSSCNRLRLTSDGQLRTCLFDSAESDLRTPMRDGASDEELAMIIRKSVMIKQEGHSIDKATGERICFSAEEKPMGKIGG